VWENLGGGYPRLAGIDTVPSSVWRVGGMRFTECRLVITVIIVINACSQIVQKNEDSRHANDKSARK